MKIEAVCTYIIALQGLLKLKLVADLSTLILKAAKRMKRSSIH